MIKNTQSNTPHIVSDLPDFEILSFKARAICGLIHILEHLKDQEQYSDLDLAGDLIKQTLKEAAENMSADLARLDGKYSNRVN